MNHSKRPFLFRVSSTSLSYNETQYDNMRDAEREAREQSLNKPRAKFFIRRHFDGNLTLIGCFQNGEFHPGEDV